MNEMISVVIPVYNVEKYLQECLDSVINQTYKNLQIIIVDDGSTDDSGIICDEYASKDSRITVVHQNNQGAGAAKNTGLELVKGDYLSLIDSDDYIESNMYESMALAMEKNNVDIVQCLFFIDYKDTSYNRNYNFPKSRNKILTTERFLFELLYDWKYAIFCNKLFKRSLLKDIRFPVGNKIDDEFFTYQLIGNSKHILNLDMCLYHYRMRQSSVMNNNTEEQFFEDRLRCFEERYIYIQSHFPKLSKEYYYHLSKNYPNQYSFSSTSLFDKVRRTLLLKSFKYDQENIIGTYYE